MLSWYYKINVNFSVEAELPPFKWWSPSSLKTIRQCPFKYMCMKLHKPKVSVKNPSRDFGTVIHKAIEDYYKSYYMGRTSKDNLEQTLAKLVKRYWKNYDLRNYEKKRDRCINEWVKFELKRISNPNNLQAKAITEGEVYDKKNKRKCIVDFYSNGVIVDWKTGKFEKFDDSMMIQGKYNEMIMEALGYKVEHVMFLVLGSGNYMPLPYVTDQTIIDMENEAFAILERGKFPKKSSALCAYCDWNLFCKLHKRKESIWRAWS